MAAIDATLEALLRLRSHLAAILGVGTAMGRCLTPGDWGRCKLTHGHREQHKIPTEAEWRKKNLPIGMGLDQ